MSNNIEFSRFIGCFTTAKFESINLIENLPSGGGGPYIATLRAKYESDLWNDVVEVVNA